MDVLRKKFKFASAPADSGGNDEPEESFTKGKLLSTWYNMKYGKAMFSLDQNSITIQSPVWLLGQCYHRRMRQRIHYADQSQSMQSIDCGITSFYQDFSSKIWMTYRKNCPQVFKGSSLNSDCGWGCMIRSGQMLLANALTQLKLGRHWRWKNSDLASVFVAEDISHEILHRNIIRLFGDSYEEPLSIHNLMDIAKELYDKKPGDWFGPSGTAHILSKAIGNAGDHELLSTLRCYVAKDGTVYKGDVYDLCQVKQESFKASPSFDSIINLDEYSVIDPNEVLALTNGLPKQGFVPYLVESCDKIPVENEQHLSPRKKRSLSVPSLNQSSLWIPVLVLIPVKLSREAKLNPIYANCLKSFLATETCVGIMGGKPKHSLFFIGFQDDNLIHLDPHLSQDFIDVSDEDFDVASFHTKVARKLPITKMDSSCCLGFLLESQNQFEGWCELATELAKPATGSGRSDYPLFSIIDGNSTSITDSLSATSHFNSNPYAEVLNQMQQLDSIDEAGIDANTMIPPSDEDEFVFI